MHASTTAVGHEILANLIDIFGVLKRRAGEREDPATVYLLRHLLDRDHRRVSELAECSRLDVSTVSRHVKSLEETGLVTRVEDPDDRRASRLKITPAGVALYEAAMTARSAALDRTLAGWPEQDRRSLTALVDRLARDLNTTSEARSSN